MEREASLNNQVPSSEPGEYDAHPSKEVPYNASQ